MNVLLISEKQIEKAVDKIPVTQHKEREAKPLMRECEDELIKFDLKLCETKTKPEKEPQQLKTEVKDNEDVDKKQQDEKLQSSPPAAPPRPAKSPETEQKTVFFGKKNIKREVFFLVLSSMVNTNLGFLCNLNTHNFHAFFDKFSIAVLIN